MALQYDDLPEKWPFYRNIFLSSICQKQYTFIVSVFGIVCLMYYNELFVFCALFFQSLVFYIVFRTKRECGMAKMSRIGAHGLASLVVRLHVAISVHLPHETSLAVPITQQH